MKIESTIIYNEFGEKFGERRIGFIMVRIHGYIRGYTKKILQNRDGKYNHFLYLCEQIIDNIQDRKGKIRLGKGGFKESSKKGSINEGDPKKA